MSVPLELYERLKAFMGFDANDVANLSALRPLAERYGAEITDRFYLRLGDVPETAKLIEGRVDGLKKTHREWLLSLVGGSYGAEYLESRWRIGLAHVRIGLDPFWVESVMSFIRTSMVEAMGSEFSDPKEVSAKAASLIKACDLDLLVINLSYAEDRLERLTAFTGMKRGLIENIIRIPKKK
jgi:hypothetical protein